MSFTLGAVVAKMAEASKEIKATGIETKEPFSDSVRPVGRNIESPKLKADIGPDMKRTFFDSERPANKGGMEQPQIKKETNTNNWSKEINNYIKSSEERKIYEDAGLKEAEINGKKCLIRDDINWNQVDEKGRTNQQRAEKGLAPLDKDGNSINLHHIGQHKDSPLAELTSQEHTGNGNDTILHDKTIKTEVHGEGNEWDTERSSYWKSRAEYNKERSSY